MPWNRNDPDPLAARRRQLAEQERALSEQRRRLTEQLQPSTDTEKTVEPLVWRNEEDGARDRVPEAISPRKRNLGRQRQNDMFLVFGLIILLIVVLSIVLWVAYVRNSAVGNGT